MEFDIIRTELSVLIVKPGDVLIWRLEKAVRPEIFERICAEIKKETKELFPDNRSMVMTDTISLEIYRPDEEKNNG